MKKNLTVWKRTISSVAALAIVLSLGGPFTAVYGAEGDTAPISGTTQSSSDEPEKKETDSQNQSADWEAAAVKAIGTVTGRDAAEKIYTHLRTLADHKDAQSFQTLAAKKEYGLTSKTVSGKLSNKDHTWNLVQLDGAWYAVDVANGVFLAGSKTLLSDGKTAFGTAYISGEAAPKTVLSEENYKITVTITPKAASKVYGDSDPAFTYISNNTAIELSGSISRAPGEDAGDYAYTMGTLNFKDTAKAGQYKLTLAQNSPKFKVTKRELNVSDVVLQSSSKPADGNASVPVQQIALGNIANHDDVSVDLTKIQAGVSAADAGVYNSITLTGLTLQGAKAANYSIAGSASVNKTFAIEQPKAPEVENAVGKDGAVVNDPNSKQDEDENKDGNQTQNPGSNTPEGDGAVPPAGEDNTTTPPDGSGDNKTDNPQQPDTDNTPNTNTPPSTDTGDQTNPGDTVPEPNGKTIIIVTIISQEKIFGEEDPAPLYTLLVDDKVLEVNDQVKETYGITGEIERKKGNDAGEYEYNQGTLKITSEKYELKLSDEKAVLEILPQQVTVAVPNQHKRVNDPEPTIQYTLSKEMPVTGSVTRQAGEAEGKYSYDISGLKPENPTDQKNYVLVRANENTCFEILSTGAAIPSQKTQVFITVDPKQMTYGDTEPQPSYKLSQNIAVTGEITRRPGNDVGTYVYSIEKLKPVSELFELVLTETDTPAALTIIPKTLYAEIASVSKTYGDKDPVPTVKFFDSESRINEVKEVQTKGTVGREPGEDVKSGQRYLYNLGTLSPASSNYEFKLAETGAALTITPRTVDILFRTPDSNAVEYNYSSGIAFVEYDGKAKQVGAFYQTARGEESKVSVLYDGSAEAPKDIKTYNLTVTVNDPNYVLSDKPLAIQQMMIRRKTFNAMDITRTVSKNDTAQKSVSLSQFGVPTNANQYVYVYNMEGPNSIFAAQPTVDQKKGTLNYQLLPGLSVGMEQDIILRLLENTSYGYNEFRLKVIVGEQGYELTVQNAPSRVTLGSDIPTSSNFKLLTKYDDGTTKTESITRDMLSGYDKTATGNSSIGKKTITVSSKENSGFATFIITVEDRTIGLEVNAPDQLEYDTNDTRLDLSGGWVAMKMQSGIPQSRKSLTLSMINRSSTILRRPGTYPVKVSYNNYSLSDAFTFEVVRSTIDWEDGEQYEIDSNPSEGDFGLSLSTSNLKGNPDREDVRLVVSGLSSDDYDTLEEYMDKRNVDNYDLMDLSLVDVYNEEILEIKSGKTVTIYIPYPSGITSSKYNFTVYHLVNGRVRTEQATVQSRHLKISVNSLSPFAVAWKSKSSSLSDAVKRKEEMDAFWDDVVDTLKDTKTGKTVLVDAGDYDYIPSRVLNSIKNRNVTLKIDNDETKTIVINGQKLPGSIKSSYTMSELYDEMRGVTSGSSSSGNLTSSAVGTLEETWADVVKSLKSYQEGTTITINAKDNANLPKTVLDAIRGRNVTVKLKSDNYPTISLNGKEMPVTLENKKQYSVKELYDASVPASVNELESLWSDVANSLKSYKSGAKVTINAGNNAFIPETILDAIRGRNVTVELKSDYTSKLITLNGASLPKSLSGESYYTIAQLVNRAKSGGSIRLPNTGNPESSYTSAVNPAPSNNGGGNSQGGIQQSSASPIQSSAVTSTPVSSEVSGSSESSQPSKIVAPPSGAIVPPDSSGSDTVPSIEETQQSDNTILKVVIGVMVFAVVLLLGVLVFLLSGKRPRQRTK